MILPTFPATTAITAAALALLQLGLMLRVSNRRAAAAIGIGDGGDGELARRIRAHGNLAENAPLFLVLLLLTELSGRLPALAIIAAGAFVVARGCHAIGLSGSSGATILRFIGATGTLLSIAILALALLYLALPSLSVGV